VPTRATKTSHRSPEYEYAKNSSVEDDVLLDHPTRNVTAIERLLDKPLSAGELYAFPLVKLHRIERILMDEIRPVQGKQQFTLDGVSVGLVRGAEILNLEDRSSNLRNDDAVQT
jgi:hypothetical protein